MRIVDFIEEGSILPNVRAGKKNGVIHELAASVAGRHDGIQQQDVVRVIQEREKQGSTAVDGGLAIPHAKLESAGKLVGLLGRSRKGVSFGAEDGRPTHFFFLLLAPQRSSGDHLKALARISRIFRNGEFRKRLMAAETGAEMYRIIEEEDASAR